jgi:hypothetical protein
MAANTGMVARFIRPSSPSIDLLDGTTTTVWVTDGF